MLDAKAHEGLLDLIREQRERAPKDAKLHEDAGRAFFALGRWEDARRELERGLELGAEEGAWRLRPTLAQALARLGDHEAALEIAEKQAEDLEDDVPWLHAYLHLAAGKFEEAAAAMLRLLDEEYVSLEALQEEPFFATLLEREDVRTKLASVRARSDYLEEALEVMGEKRWNDLLALSRARMEVAESHADAYYYAGYALAQQQAWEEAIPLLEQGMAKDLPSEVPYYLEELIPAKLHVGATGEAEALGERLKEYPDAGGAELSLFFVAYAHALGDEEEALATALKSLFKDSPYFVQRVEGTAVFAPFLERSSIAPLLRRAHRALEDE